ncbi:uncharacterized protein LOC135193515 [Vanessa tameamea]|uniref:Uncharacterized protein LOC135193515 n=1 Tax=Vanessa tameamea TaxID=334116 RepID=A0ABM4AM56_VANTA
MGALKIWSIVVILYQTIISVLISWWTLDCSFTPDSSELHEVTLMKLLYLYDPEACGRIYFYNISINHDYEFYSTVIWPIRNEVASSFRRKIRLWLSIHVVWLLLGIVNVTHGQRSCGFYAVLLPFTLTGVTSLMVDLIFMSIFLSDIEVTRTEIAILQYIAEPGSFYWINKPFPWNYALGRDEDTSWISLLFAYISCRGIVQWFINFWLVKDNYIAGIAAYHRIQKEKSSAMTKV